MPEDLFFGKVSQTNFLYQMDHPAQVSIGSLIAFTQMFGSKNWLLAHCPGAIFLIFSATANEGNHTRFSQKNITKRYGFQWEGVGVWSHLFLKYNSLTNGSEKGFPQLKRSHFLPEIF